MKTTVYTIGHSTHPFNEFLEILKAFQIKKLVDVRTIPKSFHNPQFNSGELKEALKAHRIGYLHEKGLGGLRSTHKDSVNTGWKNRSFRGYADYMQTEEFEKSLGSLVELARRRNTVIMCAEAVPWRCHRSLIGDALLVRGLQVEDIMTAKSSRPHKLTPWAKVEGYKITYPEAIPEKIK